MTFQMSRVSKNILFNLIGQVLIVGLGFVGTRLVFKQLGEEPLGILYFALAIYAVLTPLLDMGLSSTLVREVASHLATDPDYVYRLSRTGTLFYWTSYILLSTIIWIGTPWIVSHWISIKSLNASVAQHALRILALSLLLMLPRSFYSNLLRGVQRMEFNNLIDVGTIALHQAGTVLVVMLGGGLVEIAYCYLVALLVSNLVYIMAVKRFFPWYSLLPSFSLDVLQRNFSFTAHMAAFAVLAMVQMEADKALVSKFLPIGLVGFYGVAQTLVARVSRIPGAINQASYPRFSALFHKGENVSLIREYRRLQDLVCFGLVPIFAAIILASQPLFTYLLSPEAADILFLPSVLLCLGWYMNGTLNTPFTFSLAVGRPDINARQNFYALFIVLPVTVLLIWKWGLVGAGLSSLFYHTFAYAYSARRWALECLGMPAWQWYRHVLLPVGLAVGTYGSTWLVLSLTDENSIPAIILGYFIASALYVCFSFFAVGKELREGFFGSQQRKVGGVLRGASSD